MNRALVLGGLGVVTGGLTLTEVAHAASWEKIDSENGIDVFKKEVPGSKLHAFRGTALVDAPMDKVMWVLADNTHRTEWVDRLKKSVVLEKRSEYVAVIYQHFGSPPMISDRDFVYVAKAYSKSDGTAVLDINSTTHPKAPSTVGVRGTLEDCSYLLTRKGEKTFVDVSIILDPKGALPAWVVNLVQKSWPMKTLTGLRNQVKKGFVGSLATPPMR
jgi:hypothetical protein